MGVQKAMTCVNLHRRYGLPRGGESSAVGQAPRRARASRLFAQFGTAYRRRRPRMAAGSLDSGLYPERLFPRLDVRDPLQPRDKSGDSGSEEVHGYAHNGFSVAEGGACGLDCALARVADEKRAGLSPVAL